VPEVDAASRALQVMLANYLLLIASSAAIGPLGIDSPSAPAKREEILVPVNQPLAPPSGPQTGERNAKLATKTQDGKGRPAEQLISC